SRLYSELSVILSEELREPAVYSTILSALANNCNKLNDIYRHTGFSRAKISVYLKNLMELDLVEKVYSYETDSYSDTQKGVYRITNPYVRFYYRFLFPNMSLLQRITPQEFYEQELEDRMPAYIEEAYRKICRESIRETASYIGEWLGKSCSLDVVAKGTNGQMIVANCSYCRQMTMEDYEWLRFCIKKAKIASPKLYLYCEKGFSAELMKLSATGDVELIRIFK
ncbi:MAG: ArsR family transcriptional regulator, partial [Acetatifactor sp.]|nr:ArsR family transcriptional regulator [Acetatifactor sp.]